MKIENNVLKYHLKNVYWIGGTACAGKTTAAHTLSQKHNFYHYDADKMFDKYREIADETSQPKLSLKFESLIEYFDRPIDEYIEYLESINRESFEMMIIDLIKLSEDKKVIVEGHYPPELMKELTGEKQIIFLVAKEAVIRKDYFDREDKQSMLQAIRDASTSEDLVNHVLDVVVKNAKHQIEVGKACNYKFIERTSSSSVEGTLKEIENHFGLNK